MLLTISSISVSNPERFAARTVSTSVVLIQLHGSHATTTFLRVVIRILPPSIIQGHIFFASIHTGRFIHLFACDTLMLIGRKYVQLSLSFLPFFGGIVLYRSSNFLSYRNARQLEVPISYYISFLV